MNLHPLDAGKANSWVRWSAVGRLPSDDLRAALRAGLLAERSINALHRMRDRVQIARGAPRIIHGWNYEVRPVDGQIILHPKPNLVVKAGVQNMLDRWVGRNGPPTAMRSMGVDNGTTNPVAESDDSTTGSGADTGSSNRRIVLFDATPSRSGELLSMLGTYSQATVAFVMKRLFLSIAAAGTTDANGDLMAMTNVFTVDYTGFSTWSQTFTATVTGAGS